MTRTEWLNELRVQLNFLPREEAEEAMRYYEEYFEDSELGDDEVIASLGTPKSVAESFRSTEDSVAAQNVPKRPVWLYVLLGIVALPVIAPLVIAAGGTLFGIITAAAGVIIGIIAALFALCVALMGGGAALLVRSLFLLASPPTSLLTIGMGLAAIGFGLLALLLLALLIVKTIPAFIRLIVSIFTKLFGKRGGEK